MEYLPILTEAIQNSQNKPTATKVVEALLTAEKTNKHQQYNFTQLLGTWRLCFITGTKKTREKAGVILGAGQYIPKLTQIYLSYAQSSVETGYVSNSVTLGTFKLTLTALLSFFRRKTFSLLILPELI